MLLLVILLGCLASAHGWCVGCTLIESRSYCCYDEKDNTYCCSAEEYFKGGFLDMQTVTILVAVSSVIVILLVITCICCFCCSFCPCYKRRHPGVVYNRSVHDGRPQLTNPHYVLPAYSPANGP